MPLRVRAEGSAATMDRDEVKRALRLLASTEPGHHCQLVALPGAEAFSRPGGDVGGLVEAAGRLADRNVYVTLNPVKGGLHKKASSADVLQRRWLFLDIDRWKGEADKHDPATDQEKEQVRLAAEQLRDHLASEGWPAPILIDSGNGWYLLWRCHLPADSHTQAVVRAWTHAMGARVKDLADVDRAVHNADRIAALPGTQKRKGTPSDDRPWRPVRLVYVPDVLEVVSHEQIVDATPVPEPAASSNGNGHAPKQKGKFVLTAGSSAAIAYVKKAVENCCAMVALARPGDRNNVLNKAAYSLGGLIATGHLKRSDIEEKLTACARQCGLHEDPACGEGGIARSIQSGIEKGMAKPRQVFGDTPPTPSVGSNGAAASSTRPEGEWELHHDDVCLADGKHADLQGSPDGLDADGRKRIYRMHSLSHLMEIDMPEPSWVVPGLLSEGLNILAGKPKMGKSILALNLGMTIAGGGKALGNIRTIPGDVLYLALEDKERRLQTRARLIARAAGYSVSSRLTLATEWPRLHEGGLKLLTRWFERVERPTLLIIDVWAVFRPPYRAGSQYEQDYEHLSALKQFVEKRHCTALVLLHCRKGASEDVLEEVSGTMGQTGAADGILVLNRSRANNEATVFVTGRDVEEQELAIRFEAETLTWTSLGPAEQHIQGRLQSAVVDYLRGLGPNSSAFANDIAQTLNEEPNKIRMTLLRLLQKRVIRRKGNAWSYPGECGEGEADDAVF